MFGGDKKLKRAGLGLAVLVALLLSGCGDDSGLDRAQLIAEGDAICASHSATIEEKATGLFKRDPSPQQLIRFVRRQVTPVYRQQAASLRALEPDSGSAEEWNAMLDQLDAGIEQFSKNPAAAVRGGVSPLAEAGAAARKFGLKVCGSGD